MNIIIPTIFAANNQEFKERFAKLIKISKNIQIDFMDGKFVKAKGIALKDVPNLKRYKNNFEAHLMVRNPNTCIKKLKEKGFKKVIFHYEAIKNRPDIEKLAEKIKSSEMRPFIAINPETSANKIFPFLKKSDGILIMGVHPGREHQSLKFSVIKKIKQIREESKRIRIQVDGGVNTGNIRQLKKAGANLFNSGSFVAKAGNPGLALKKLEQA